MFFLSNRIHQHFNDANVLLWDIIINCDDLDVTLCIDSGYSISHEPCQHDNPGDQWDNYHGVGQIWIYHHLFDIS